MTRQNFWRSPYKGTLILFITKDKTVRILFNQIGQDTRHTKRCITCKLHLTGCNYLCHLPMTNAIRNSIHQIIPIRFIITSFMEIMTNMRHFYIFYANAFTSMQIKGFPIFYDVVMGERNHFMPHSRPLRIL